MTASRLLNLMTRPKDGVPQMMRERMPQLFVVALAAQT